MRAEGPFDGEWKGKFYAQTPEVCMFREKYFDATVKDNEFTAVIDQEGTKRKFEGTIGKDGEVSIWGMWDSFHAAYRNRSGIYPMSIGGQFSGFSFIGTFEADLQWGAHCRGTVYLAACRTEVRENGCGRIAMWRGHGIERLS